MEEWKKIFSNRNFFYLFVSQNLSQVTIQLLNFLFILKIYSETGSSLATSIVWIFYALPSLIFGPFAATLVDFFDRRKLLIYTNLFQAVLVFLLSFLFGKSIFTIYFVVFLYSTLNQLYVPAETVSLTEVVKKKDLSVANGVFFTSTQVAIIFGFLIAGIFNKFLGFSITLYISSIFLLIAFVSVTFLPSTVTKKTALNLESNLMEFIKEIFEGYNYIRSNQKLLYSYILQIIMTASLTVVVVNIPEISKTLLRMHSDLGSIFIVLPTVIGSIASSYLIPKLLLKNRRKIKIIYKSLMTLVFVLFFLAIIFPEINNQTIRILIQVLSFGVLGYSFVGVVIPLQTLIQEESPVKLRGRVLGNLWFVTTLINIFPILFSGIISEVFGIRVLLTILFFMFLAITIFIKKNQSKLYVEL
ncbi:MAG: hypothetical protein US62_C0010G0008 [Candidatus Woesebacteria bacterium GW2011_GWA1_37_8]|uniref:Major facilitator superfamily (MFS) profile domain-containing protein n=2 Tax=Candidatus Woeseibacteriota TaxID=1752722 RepID=A0A0G0L5T7_9BACT|nr:MAG: hypothetical protein US39_C0006G0003 [Microgenomates group bacterium GW2011_GWC1_37_12b]KKQ45723.1 MAG: hypothetical protein US62_C0010G0008 [Candidatus Woesebacteria bacterium GW2011_GWA1_37_8]KKQ87373.1 MAG: hypothetical protein UT10_C0007G0031 [Candidatus Woesebacteria bacterium GW2011_GWB1_38_8b]